MSRPAPNTRLVFRTSVFRFALIYAAIFLVSVLALVSVLHWATIGGVSRQIDATIESEIVGLAEQYERRGLNGLIDVLTDRVNRASDGRAIYLFADSGLRRLAGNLERWPSEISPSNGQIEFDARSRDGSSTRYRASILSVGRYRLLVGRDIREIAHLDRVFRRTTIWGVAVVLILAFSGGTLMGFGVRRRIVNINRTARRIIDGDLSERVPISGRRDEYDDLADNINEMLTQIEALLEHTRHIGNSIAHDLRSPLTRLRNRLESLSGSGLPDRAELEKCVADSDRLLATFNALLRIARIESGVYRTGFSEVDLATIVCDAVDLYSAAAEEKNIALTVEPSERATLYGDRELLSQAVVNVLDNAVKYTPAGGRIDIEIIEHSDRLELAIMDSGSGVPIEDHARIQQRFVRLDAARCEPGNGLGLSLVKAVVDQHKGSLQMQNLDPGLKVTLLLPRNLIGSPQVAALPSGATAPRL